MIEDDRSNIISNTGTSTVENRRLSISDAEKELGKVALKLCVLSYHNHDLPKKTKELEDELCRKFEIIINDAAGDPTVVNVCDASGNRLDAETDSEKDAPLIIESVAVEGQEEKEREQEQQGNSDNKQKLIEDIRQKTNNVPFRIWNDTRDSVLRPGKIVKESQALTGFVIMSTTDVDSIFGPATTISAEVPSEWHAIPFVCFRGTVTETDMIRDLNSIRSTKFETSNKNKFGKCGSGFYEMHSQLLNSQSTSNNVKIIDVVKQSLALTGHRGLLICGHSLGGAAATLFFTELLVDGHFHPPEEESEPRLHTDESKVRIVTFGSPRTVNKKLAKRLNQSKAIHLRFVNKEDIITCLPPTQLYLYYHWGKCISVPKEDQKYWMVIYDNKESNRGWSRQNFDAGNRTNCCGWCTCLVDFVCQLSRSCFQESVPNAHSLDHQDGYVGYFEDPALITLLETLLRESPGKSAVETTV